MLCLQGHTRLNANGYVRFTFPPVKNAYGYYTPDPYAHVSTRMGYHTADHTMGEGLAMFSPVASPPQCGLHYKESVWTTLQRVSEDYTTNSQ